MKKQIFQCIRCKTAAPPYQNYCSWECHVDHARELGVVEHCPNGLPIRSIGYMLLEHEHGDHADYKFPVDVEYIAVITDDDRSDAIMMGYGKNGIVTDDEVRDSRAEIHALIYTDGSVAMTIYETCYAIWGARSGELFGGNLWSKKEWRLSFKALADIAKYLKKLKLND